MKIIEVDLKELETNHITAETDDLIFNFIFNNYDNYIYISINDRLNNVIVGYNRLVPNTDFLSLSNNKIGKQLRCIKVNEYAEERDYITIKNINKDYKFVLI